MKKGIKYSLLGLLAVIIIALTGASFYMLGYSLRPEHNKGKDIPGSYEYMLSEYPQIKPWIDSLQTVGALRDTFIINPEGVQLHAIYAAAPQPAPQNSRHRAWLYGRLHPHADDRLPLQQRFKV